MFILHVWSVLTVFADSASQFNACRKYSTCEVRLRIADAKALGAGNIEPCSADGANDIVKITPVVHVRPNNVPMLCIRVVDMQVHCLHSDGVNHCLP